MFSWIPREIARSFLIIQIESDDTSNILDGVQQIIAGFHISSWLLLALGCSMRAGRLFSTRITSRYRRAFYSSAHPNLQSEIFCCHSQCLLMASSQLQIHQILGFVTLSCHSVLLSKFGTYKKKPMQQHHKCVQVYCCPVSVLAIQSPYSHYSVPPADI